MLPWQSPGNLVFQYKLIKAARQIGGYPPDDKPPMRYAPGRPLARPILERESIEALIAHEQRQRHLEHRFDFTRIADEVAMRPHLGDHRRDQVIGGGEIGGHVTE